MTNVAHRLSPAARDTLRAAVRARSLRLVAAEIGLNPSTLLRLLADIEIPTHAGSVALAERYAGGVHYAAAGAR